MQNEQATPQQAPPPRNGCLLVGIPIFVAIFWIVAYSIVFSYGIRGRSADGPIKEMLFSTCPDGFKVITQRATAMGLGQIETQLHDGQFMLRAQLPSQQASITEIPNTLAASGEFQIVTQPNTPLEQLALTAADLTEISLEVNHTGAPFLKLSITPEATVGLQSAFSEDQNAILEVRLDQQAIATFPLRALGRNLSRIKLDPPAANHQEEVELAAKWSLLLHYPLPCPAQLVAVTP